MEYEKKNSSLGVIILIVIFAIAAFAGGYYISDSNMLGKKEQTKKEETKSEEDNAPEKPEEPEAAASGSPQANYPARHWHQVPAGPEAAAGAEQDRAPATVKGRT